MPSQTTKETKAKLAKLTRIVLKKFNDELLNLKIILDKMEEINAIWHQQIIEIDEILKYVIK